MLTSTLLPLALVSAVASSLPSVAASPIQLAGQAPSVIGNDGKVSRELLQHGFEQAIKRSVGQLETTKLEPRRERDCDLNRRSRKSKRSTQTIPLINQNDIAYAAPIEVGTPAQQVHVLLDTGSADLLVPIKTEAFPAGTYEASRSRTLRKGDGSKTLFKFGDGNVEAEVVQDKVRIGQWIKLYQPFGLVDPSWLGQPAGLLGLSFSSISKIGSGTSFFDYLIKEKKLDKNLFGLYHTRGGASGSQLTLGAADSRRFSGELTTLPTKSQTHWTLELNEATIDGETIFSDTVYAAIDSGSTQANFARVKGSFADPKYIVEAEVNGERVVGQIYGYDCDATLPKLGFKFDGSDRVFEIDPADIFSFGSEDERGCYSNFIGADVTYYGQKAALIGVPFLKTWYSVFNFDDATVSFAAAKH
ncbi:uncharacterized protein JCM15063_000991 [Sporobolomyces koalae]|uniref:uncharacterized protein n=1 Tax=Sporobolomyces koalae TaxID=500713 RepID=UPI00316C0328